MSNTAKVFDMSPNGAQVNTTTKIPGMLSGTMVSSTIDVINASLRGLEPEERDAVMFYLAHIVDTRRTPEERRTTNAMQAPFFLTGVLAGIILGILLVSLCTMIINP